MSSMSGQSLVGFKLPVTSFQFPEKTRLVCGDCDCENGFARKWGIGGDGGGDVIGETDLMATVMG